MPPRVALSRTSAWTLPSIEEYLARAVIPCRLSCVTPSGYPHVNSLWFLYRDGALWFSMQRASAVARWLTREPRCAFEVAADRAPYRGVRGRGDAVVRPAREAPVLDELIARYLGRDDTRLARWLLSRAATEVTVRVAPVWLGAWDYSARMAPP